MIYVLIPAYMPDEKLIALLNDIKEQVKLPVLIVNDGSDCSCDPIFKSARDMGAEVLTHSKNKGKGAALRTGIDYLSDRADGIITADADGQHTAKDIKKIADAMQKMPDTFITGGRDFSKMPLRSRFGNSITYLLFFISTRIRIKDTQTGLRGIPACLFQNVLEIEGDRYEYEMNVLLHLKEWNAKYREIPISTLYIANNKSSHFRPINDGLRVFFKIIIYILSSLSCTAADYLLYIVLGFFNITPALRYAIARACSSVLNYELNCRIVFKNKPSLKNALEYGALVLVALAIGTFGVNFLTSHDINSVLAKIIIDTVLFVGNYIIQHTIIFPASKRNAK